LPVEFIIEPTDLRQATSQLKANRGRHKETDFVDILVSECAATFRAVGAETEVPVEGKIPGSVRVPLRIVDKIEKAARSFKTAKLKFSCEPGVIKIEGLSLKHPDIQLGKLPDQRVSLPIDLSLLDTLALTKILTASQIVEEGMRERVEEAWGARTFALTNALTALRPLEVEDWQLSHLVDCHIEDAAKRLRKSLQIP